MKKVIISILVPVVIIVAAVLILMNSNFFEKKPFLSDSSKPEEIIAFYADTVKNSKNISNDFSLDIETSVELKDIDSSATILNTALEGIMGYSVGDIETKKETVSFSNGVSSDDAMITPFSVIQPENTYIESVNYNTISAVSVENNMTSSLISFDIAKESADMYAVLNAINPIIKGEVTNSSALMKLTPYHSKFINVDNVFATVVDMLGVDRLTGSNGSSESKSSGSKAIQIISGKCSIGNSQIIADVNENYSFNEVTIKVPVEFHAVIKFMSNNIDTSIKIEVSQHYIFRNNS